MAPPDRPLSRTGPASGSGDKFASLVDTKGSGKWAILIGVSFYTDGNARLVHARHLSGPSADINSMREFFIRHLGVQQSNILTLKSTVPLDQGTNLPVEQDTMEWPTYENIFRIFDLVTNSAAADDLVYIYYSGHGGRATTIFREKGPKGVDEALAPMDINSGGRYVRDVEIAAILQMMAKKKLHVTLILDSCHSGGATKGILENPSDAAVSRGLGTLDVTNLPTDKSDIPQVVLDDVFKTDAFQHQSREDFWLEPQGYVLMAACLPIQTAWELPFDKVYRGIFTHFLTRSLEEAVTDGVLGKLTHNMLHQRVLANVIDFSKGIGKSQIPVLMGSSNRLFINNSFSKSINSFSVLKMLVDGVQVSAGRAHGVREGDYYGIYRWNKEVVTPGESIAIVRVDQVLEREFIGRFVREFVVGTVHTGDQAVLLRRHISMSSNLKLLSPQDADESLLKKLNHLRELLRNTQGEYKSGINPLQLLDGDVGGLSPLFHVTFDRVGRYQLLDSQRHPIPNIRTFEEPESVLNIARKLARFVRFRDLRNPDKSTMSFSMKISLHSKFHFQDPCFDRTIGLIQDVLI